MEQQIHTNRDQQAAVSWMSCVQISVVLMFLIAIILYRTILQIVIYNSTSSFDSFSVSTHFMFSDAPGHVCSWLYVVVILTNVFSLCVCVLRLRG